jgi:hypothetical protein
MDMKVYQWFNPANVDHIIAYKEARKTGKWAKGFLPEDKYYMDLMYDPGTEFFRAITQKIADAWVDQMLDSGLGGA